MQIGIEHIGAMLTALCAVIAALWKLSADHTKKEQERLLRCEDLHMKSTDEVKTLYGEVNRLRGEMDGVLKGVEGLSRKVLDKIEETNK